MKPEDVKIPFMPEMPRLHKPEGKPWLTHKVCCEDEIHEFFIAADGECQLLHHEPADTERLAGFAELGGSVSGCYHAYVLTQALLKANQEKLPDDPADFVNTLINEVKWFWHSSDEESLKEVEKESGPAAKGE